MKKLFILFVFGLTLSSTFLASAQSFSLADTAKFQINNSTSDIYSNITIPSSSVTLKWHVSETNFPADWLAATGICDNVICYPMSSLWPSGTINTSNIYAAGTGGFHMVFNGSSITHVGTYYLKVKFLDPSSLTNDSTVFVLTAIGPSKVTSVSFNDDNVALYPNPARNEVNLVFDNVGDVRSISLYNNIGTIVATFKTQATSANLNLENIPAGIYFARLMDGQGTVVATRRFTKQ